ncbi:calcitonin gene-related peptide 2 [Erythrolamprus reginae]|uniref:calcitonin gene-related peptide 2 n=1 Tax=Erythrolamprus reginae TaxID=121349 RepID=UPI00396C77FB
MAVLKISSLLAVYALVACQMENGQAVPLRRKEEERGVGVAGGPWLVKAAPSLPLPIPTRAACKGGRTAAPGGGKKTTALLRARFCLSRRTGFEPVTDRGALGDYEARRLLNALVKEYVQMTAEDPDQGGEGSSITAQKRACNTATCVTHRLADFLNRSGGVGKSTFVPTNVGAHAFGRRRRNIQI